MQLNTLIKRLRNEMRNDAGVSGDAQRLEQMTWLFFLKIYDAREEEWEILDEDYHSIIPERLRWHSWAANRMDGSSMTGPELIDFVNNELFPGLRNLNVTEDTSLKQAIVKAVFEDVNNYMKDGGLLRGVVNIIDEVDFTDFQERHAFNDIYESLLKELQDQGSSGEFYTPRALTDFIVKMVDPKLGESVADFACGTGGFLTSTLKHLEKQTTTSQDADILGRSVYGIEKKPFPYLLCITNMILHGVDTPMIFHTNSLERNVRDYEEKDKFDVIVMNPPYGGSEKDIVKNNFPMDLRSSETADLFIVLIMYRLKKNGRAAVILPDGFLFGSDVKANIKKRLMSEFNLHTIIRLPGSVFAPYTSIKTNVLFFDNTGPTEKTWFYRVDMPEGYKHFSKTKPMRLEHLQSATDWWNDRVEIEDSDGNYKAKCYTIDEIEQSGYDLNRCDPVQESDEILPPEELIANFRKKRAELTAKMDEILGQIEKILGEKQ